MDSKMDSVKRVKIFFSYSTKDKHNVGLLKKDLELWGFEVFLAHEDINPSYKWQEEIYKNILECNIFIPYLTKHFKESEWTDQECGIAYTHSKLIIPLQVELTPYGFINKFQSLKFNPERISPETDKIVQVISNNKKFGDSKEFIIERFINSGDFLATNKIAQKLRNYDTFSEEEIKRICKGSLRNSQVLGAYGGQSFLKILISEYGEYVDPSDLSKLKKILKI